MDKTQYRLDAFVAKSLSMSRADAKKMLRQKRITVYWLDSERPLDTPLAANMQVDIQQHVVKFDGRTLSAPRHYYFVLHKPPGYVCSSEDSDGQSVLHLLDPIEGLQIVGRLDKDTSGMLFLTTDGDFNHFISSPRKQCIKRYHIHLKHTLDIEQQADWIEKLSQGILLRGEDKPCLPVTAHFLSDSEVIFGVLEGRYHLVKRLVAALGNRLQKLHRVSIGNIQLEDALSEGDARELTTDDLKELGYR